MKRIVCILTLMLPLMVAAQAPADTTRPDPNKFVQVEVQPKPINMSDFSQCLKYPATMLKQKISGKVILKVLVDERGYPIDHRVNKTPHPDFIPTATECLYKGLIFTPALQNGKPIKFWIVMPVDFTL